MSAEEIGMDQEAEEEDKLGLAEEALVALDRNELEDEMEGVIRNEEAETPASGPSENEGGAGTSQQHVDGSAEEAVTADYEPNEAQPASQPSKVSPVQSVAKQSSTSASRPAPVGPAGQIESTFMDALKTEETRMFTSTSFRSSFQGVDALPVIIIRSEKSSVQLRSKEKLPSIERSNVLRATYPPPASHQRSQMGPQAESSKRSAPHAMFSTSSRFDDRVFISPEHTRVTAPRGNPGPGTYNTAGRFLRGKSPTKCVELPSLSPHGKQGGDRGGGASAAEPPAAPFAVTEPRFHTQNVARRMASEVPGPGEYRVNTPQRLSSLCHGIGQPVGFSKGKRIRKPAKGFEAEFLCTLSPGPMYLPNAGAAFRHAASAGFGKGMRDVDPTGLVLTAEQLRASRIPGPGAYQSGGSHMDGVYGSKSFAESGTGTHFGSATRDQAAMASLLPSQANKLCAGRAHADGPAAYDITRGKVDHLSKASHAPSFPFGSDKRFSADIAAGPGPGSYCV